MTSAVTTPRGRLRAEWSWARQLARPLAAPADDQAPLPPPLPPGATVALRGRGETFVRMQPGPERPAERGTGPERPAERGIDTADLPVLLLHGWTSSGDMNWFGTFPVLAGRHPAIAIDHRGHGRGMRPEAPFTLEDCADDCAALLDALGIERAVLCGYSMGGPIALLMADRHPDRVAGLVLCATALEWRAHIWERWQWRLLSLMDLTMRLSRNNTLLARTLRYAEGRNPALAPLRPWLAGELRRSVPADIVAAGRALSTFDFRPCATALAGLPSAAVLTTADRLVPPRKQRRLAAALGAAVFPIDYDHDACLVAPGELGEAVLEAVESVVARVT